jgi:hypothetical protein
MINAAWRGLPVRDDVCLRGNFLECFDIDGPALQEGTTEGLQRIEPPIRELTKARHGHRAAASDTAGCVARDTRRVIENRPESTFGVLDILKFFQTGPE